MTVLCQNARSGHGGSGQDAASSADGVGARRPDRLRAAARRLGRCRPASRRADPAPFTVRGSVHQVHVIGAPADAAIELRRKGRTVQSARTDDLGGFLFRNVDAGAGYTVVAAAPSRSSSARRCRVLGRRRRAAAVALRRPARSRSTTSAPRSGYGYLTTRDGTTLSVSVVLPGPADQGPYPTVVEYSGYDPSSPTHRPTAVQAPRARARHGVDRREHPRHRLLRRRVQLLREPPVARRLRRDRDGRGAAVVDRPGRHGRHLVRRHQPALRRPHAAAAPRARSRRCRSSTTRGAARSTPAASTTTGSRRAGPRSGSSRTSGRTRTRPGWVKDRIAGGDTVCADNMDLRGQNVDLLEQTEAAPVLLRARPAVPLRLPRTAATRSRRRHSSKDIKAPVFIAGAWQDEQTGGRWAEPARTASRRRPRSGPSARTASTPSRSTRACSPR